MPSANIKSGDQVIADFLQAAEHDASLHQDVVAAIRKLVTQGKLNKTQLLRSLESLRATAEQDPRSGYAE